MTTTRPRSGGFTIVELSLVLIVLGILAVALAPMIQVIHDDSMREQDMATMDAAKNALLGYVRVNGGLPCIDSAGTPVSSGCDAVQTLEELGVRATDSRRRDFLYAVSETLTVSEIISSGNSFCTALANIINPPVATAVEPDPHVCVSSNAATGTDACTQGSPMAFVMVGRGSDRCLNLENTQAGAVNDPVCPAAASENGTFENPVRIHSKTQDEGYYDDLVVAMTHFEMAEVLGCAVGGGSGSGFSYCLDGETLVQVINGVNNYIGVDLAGACYTVNRGTSASLGCLAAGTTLEVHGNTSCNDLQLGATVGSLDTNSDGRIDIVCTNSNCTAR